MPDHNPVLVTGAAGYVGSHVVNQLVRAGHHVRAAVRSAQRAQVLRDTLAAAGADAHGMDFVLADLTADDGWGEAVAGVQSVLHIASPFPAEIPQNDDDIIVPAREGTLRVLRHARDAGCTKVILTSSFAAVGYSPKATSRWTEEDWTDPADDNTAYIRSKAIAERAAWDFVAREDAAHVTTDEYSEDEVRELAATVPAVREALTRLGQRPQISNAKAKALLGWSPRPVNDTIIDTARSLLERNLL